MIGERLVFGLIPARGGSRRVPGKNLRPLGGRPLIDWTVRAALASARLDQVCVSGDSDEILAAARAAGCTSLVRRPPEISYDEATSVDAALHALDVVGGAWG